MESDRRQRMSKSGKCGTEWENIWKQQETVQSHQKGIIAIYQRHIEEMEQADLPTEIEEKGI